MSTATISRRKAMQIKRWAKRILVAAIVMQCLMSLLVPAALAAGPEDITLTVKQTFIKTGTARTLNETFSYSLRPERLTNPMPSGSIKGVYDFDITGTASKSITTRFTTAGVYEYELNNTTAPASGYIYDEDVYTLKITVNNDRTHNLIIYRDDGSKSGDIQYKHYYDYDERTIIPSDPELMADPPLVKTIDGSPAMADTFSFRLAAGNPSNPMPSGSSNGMKTVQIKGAGQAKFGTWSYAREGVYFYTVSEVIPTGASSYKYDTTEYTIADTVTAVDRKLIVSRVVTNNQNRQVGSCSFINTYTGSGGTTPQSKPPGDASGMPKTGDDSRITIYIVLLCAAGITALICVWYLLAYRRRGENKDDT